MVALALTLIQGPLVDIWKDEIGEWLDNLDPEDDVPELWEQFKEEFSDQFLDSQQAQKAMNKLEDFRMKWPYIDQYITDFEQLCREAGYTQGEASTSQRFLKGLPDDVLSEVIKTPRVRTYQDMKVQAIQTVQALQLINGIKKNHQNQGNF